MKPQKILSTAPNADRGFKREERMSPPRRLAPAQAKELKEKKNELFLFQLNDDIIKGSFGNIMHLIFIPVIAGISVFFNRNNDHLFFGLSKGKN